MRVRKLVDTPTAASIVGLSKDTLATWRNRYPNRLPFIKLSRNVVRYDMADLDRYVSECTVGRPQPRDEEEIDGTGTTGTTGDDA